MTTLTKRMAEDLTEYYQQAGLRVRYLHSDIDTLDRIAIIRDLRLGKFDALVGINLLREGLDIPEVSLVAILDADKEGYLRSGTSLIQTSGRAARNVNGEVIMYGDKVTDSMAAALRETERRRAIQGRYNEEHGITPESIRSSIRELLQTVYERDYYTVEVEAPAAETFASPAELAKRIAEMEAADAGRRPPARLRAGRRAARPGQGPEATAGHLRRGTGGSEPRPPGAGHPRLEAAACGRYNEPCEPRREARSRPRPAGRLHLPRRQGPGDLRGQGRLAAQPRAVVLPGRRAPTTPRPTRWCARSPTSSTS